MPAALSETHRVWLTREWPIPAGLLTAGLFLLFADAWWRHLTEPVWAVLLVTWLLVVVVAIAFTVVRHAERLAGILGEPLGTLVLTLSAICIEVIMITAVMLTGQDKPTLARDTMFAALMIVLNGMIGLSLLLGGLRHHEQAYNFYGANAYLSLIVPLAVLGLVLPNFTSSSPGPTLSPVLSVFLALMSIGLYAVFVASQTLRHRSDFMPPGLAALPPDHDAIEPVERADRRTVRGHAWLIVLGLLPLGFLAKQLAVPLDYAARELSMPMALSGLLVAAIVLSSESLSAVRAALGNRLQRSINVLFGAALSTTGLTIPAVIAVGFLTEKTIILGLETLEMVLLILTLAVSVLTFTGSRTTFLQGAVHLLLFFAYLALLFEG